MSYSIAKEFKVDPNRTMAKTYRETMIDIASKNKKVVAMDADLMLALGMHEFQNKLPEQMINVGIAEANMIGIAAGLSATGMIPYAHTFAPFATRRCFDQLFISVAYAKANVRVIGSDPGVVAAFNGGTHMPFEDMGIMRLIPNATLIEPTDCAMLEDVLRQTENMYGLFYIRMMRDQPLIKVYEDGSTFDITKGILLEEGSDVTIIASGIMVGEALAAQSILKEKGISAEIINIACWKPIDAELIAKSAAKTGAVVTAENHNVINGLGSAVADVLAANTPAPIEKIGSMDRFGQVGPFDYLKKEYNLTKEDIVKAVEKVLARKNA